MGDSRAITKELKNMFYMENGIFYPFYLYVKNNTDKLAVCFRGNGSPEKISIYHNNHTVWELYKDTVGPKVAISFNHARYCEDWEEKMKELGKLGFQIWDDSGEILSPYNADSIGMLVCDCNDKKYKNDPINFVMVSYGIIMDMMRIFFAPKKAEDFDYFKNNYTKYKKNLAEKRWQQWLFNKLKNSNNGLFAYDLEFSQPGAKGEENTNEPDMLALRYENNQPVAIVLLEVKSLASACENQDQKQDKKSSDIYHHIKGMREYSQSNNIKSRREEVHKILKDYAEMKLYVKENQIIPEENNELPVECAIIFTTADLIDIGHQIKSGDSAIHYYFNNEDRIKTVCESEEENWKCDIYLVGNFMKNKKYPAKIYTLPEEWN